MLSQSGPEKSWDEIKRLIPSRKIPGSRDFAKISFRPGLKFLIPLGPGEETSVYWHSIFLCSKRSSFQRRFFNGASLTCSKQRYTRAPIYFLHAQIIQQSKDMIILQVAIFCCNYTERGFLSSLRGQQL